MGAIKGSWYEKLKDEFGKPYYRELYEKVRSEYSTRVIYPPSREIFSAFEFTPLEKIKVVISLDHIHLFDKDTQKTIIN